MKEPSKPTFKVTCAGLDLVFDITGTQKLRIDDRRMLIGGRYLHVTITVVQREGRWVCDYVCLSDSNLAQRLRDELPATVTETELRRGRSIAERYAAWKVSTTEQAEQHARRQVEAWQRTVNEAQLEHQRWTAKLAEYAAAPPLAAQPLLAAAVDLPGVGLDTLD